MSGKDKRRRHSFVELRKAEKDSEIYAVSSRNQFVIPAIHGEWLSGGVQVQGFEFLIMIFVRATGLPAEMDLSVYSGAETPL